MKSDSRYILSSNGQKIGSSEDAYYGNLYGINIYQNGSKVSSEGHVHVSSEVTFEPFEVLAKLITICNPDHFNVNDTNVFNLNTDKLFESLPIASSSVLGGIKVGTGLTIDGNGVLNAAIGSTITGTWGGITGNIADQTDLATAISAASILTKIKTVDGAASGLDADLLDGQHGSYYAPIDSPAFTTKINVTGDAFVSGRIVAGGLGVLDSEAYFQGKIDLTKSYQYFMRFKDEAGTMGFLVVNGTAAGGFFPVFTGKVTSTLPGLYFNGNCVNGPGAGAPIVGFDGRINNTAAAATDILIGFSSGYGNLKAGILGNGTFYTAGGVHVGGTSDPGVDNLIVDGTSLITGIATFENTTNTAITNYGGISKNTYVSQLTGYRVSAAGEADFRYLYADELHVKSFIADLEQALAGGQIVAKSVAKVATDFTIPAAGAAQTLVVEEFAGFTGAVFVNGDIVRLRQFSRANNTTLDVADVWGTVVYVSRDGSANPTTQSFTFTRSAAPNAGSGSGTIKTGTLALDYGVSGNGYYEVTAVDGVNGVNSPYSQFVTWTGHPATGLTLRARIGNLSGITDADFGGALSGYGLYANNVYLKGKLVIASGTTGYSNITDKPTIPSNTNQLTDGANLGGTSTWSGVSGTGKPADYANYTTNTNQLIDGANLGGTAVWGGVSGTGKPADYATVGASWGSNISGMPGYTGPASGKGLFMNDSYMGFYNYTDYPADPWRAYIDSSGNSRFVGVTEIGTSPINMGSFYSNVAIKDNHIWENSGTDHGSALNINVRGYNAGTSYYRQTYIGDGKGNVKVQIGYVSPKYYYTFGNSGDESSADFTIFARTNAKGIITCDNTVTATNFILSSDERLKENIKRISASPVNVNYMQFNLKSEPSTKRYGCIAQELQKKNPELVRIDSEGMLSVAYIDLLIKEVAYLKDKVAELEGRIN